MKNRIFMYLFIFALLLLLFQFINSKNIFDDSNKKVATYQTKIEQYKDSISKQGDQIAELSQFSFDANEVSYDYFLNQGYDVDKLIKTVKDGLYAQNEFEGEQHPLVPYGSSDGNRMQINSIRVLNHKWIVTDFTDGQFWGELLLTYSINDKGELKYKVVESLLNPI